MLKSLSSPLLLIALYSPKGTYDSVFLANYAYINLVDELTRVPGVARALNRTCESEGSPVVDHVMVAAVPRVTVRIADSTGAWLSSTRVPATRCATRFRSVGSNRYVMPPGHSRRNSPQSRKPSIRRRRRARRTY